MLFAASLPSPSLTSILLEGMWNGQITSSGRRAFGIRVRLADGTPITPSLAALGRNIMRPADMLPGLYFVGFLAIFTNSKCQRLGDLIAGTVVCYEKRATALFVVAPHVVGFHPLEAQVGSLRGMTQEEYYALRRFCDRFPELSTRYSRAAGPRALGAYRQAPIGTHLFQTCIQSTWPRRW